MAYTVTTDQAIANTYLYSTGKATPPVSGTTKYTKLLALLNLYTHSWASEPDIDWNSLRTTFTLASLVTATDTFALPATLGSISNQEGDFVRIYHTDGVTESDYTIVQANVLYGDRPTANNTGRSHGNAIGSCAVVGQNIVFSRAFKTTDPQFGGAIKVPGFSIPPTLAGGTSEFIAVDDPNWLCFMAAAEYIRTDLTRQAQYPNLIAQATQAHAGMVDRNNSQIEEVYRGGWSPLGATFS